MQATVPCLPSAGLTWTLLFVTIKGRGCCAGESENVNWSASNRKYELCMTSQARTLNLNCGDVIENVDYFNTDLLEVIKHVNPSRDCQSPDNTDAKKMEKKFLFFL